MITRRSFLRTTSLGGSFSATLPAFLSNTVSALAKDAERLGTHPSKSERDAPILVVLHLAGGNDGLNTVVPLGNDDYRRARPQLAIPAKDTHSLNDQWGLHPSLRGFKSLFDTGNLGIVHAVGYPNPNRSHFRSSEIWATASDSQKVERHGWLGRYFDHACTGAEPTVGVALGRSSPQAFAAKKPTGISIDGRPTKASNTMDEEGSSMDDESTRMNPDVGDSGSSIQSLGSGRLIVEDPRAFLERTSLDAKWSNQAVPQVASKVKNLASYPASNLASHLKLTARLIAGGLPTRVFYLSQGGYDTHTRQAGTHTRLLSELDGALSAFVADLKALGQLDRVLVLTFSEFGRRVTENRSGGTDHGAGAPLFVFGGRTQPGLHGTPPVLTPEKLHRGDIAFNTDFRQVYATVLEQWLKTPSTPILGHAFQPLKLLR